MPSAFISYAHEDQEFMLSLVDQLQGQGLDVRYDQVFLNIGDSLIEKIAEEIADGAFVIPIVSPDSVTSNWCRKELSLAATDGINQARVKVLPVKFRKAEMPPLLADTFWADADRHTVETIARQLARAMNAHMGGADDAAAAREAEGADEVAGEPPHEERPGDAAVRQIDDAAQRVFDIFDAWHGVWHRDGNVADLEDPKRRLRWALDLLTPEVRNALPLVTRLAGSNGADFFEGAEEDAELEVHERDLRQELLAIRTRVAQGLPVLGRWMVVRDEGKVSAGHRDAVAYLWRIQRADETRPIVVYISGTAMDSEDRGLPEEVVAAKNTHGRSVLATLVGLDEPPEQVIVTTAGVSLALPN